MYGKSQGTKEGEVEMGFPRGLEHITRNKIKNLIIRHILMVTEFNSKNDAVTSAGTTRSITRMKEYLQTLSSSRMLSQ